MAPRGKAEKAPERANFNGGLVNNNDVLTAENFVTQDKRSFMDKGEDAIKDPEGVQGGREGLATGARATLKARMRQENQDSARDARDMAQKHENHKNQALMSAARNSQNLVRRAMLRQGAYLVAHSRVGVAEANESVNVIGRLLQYSQGPDTDTLRRNQTEIIRYRDNPLGFLRKKITFVGTRESSTLKDYRSAGAAIAGGKQAVSATANQWNAMLEEYREKTYKPRYAAYDRLFSSYYALSRGKDQEELSADFERSEDESVENQIANDVAKNIVEYTGIYNQRNVNTFVNGVLRNPYAIPQFEIIAGKSTKEDSGNVMDGLNKIHRLVAMESFADGVTNLAEEQEGGAQRVRMKIDNSFSGYMAGNAGQIEVPAQANNQEQLGNNPGQENNQEQQGNNPEQENDQEQQDNGGNQEIHIEIQGEEQGANNVPNEEENELAGIIQPDNQVPNQQEDNRQGSASFSKRRRGRMGLLNLVIDEKGVNGAYLFSQKSAKVYRATAKQGNRTANGFFVNGEFISADNNVLTKESQTKEKTKHWDKVAEDERLRNAIRRSDFFKHINSGTIQYYMNYDDESHGIVQQRVERSFMARRDSLFSTTKLGQSLLDGSLLSTVGGLAGTIIADQKHEPFFPKDTVDDMYGKYTTASSSILNMDKGLGLGVAGLAATSIFPIATILGSPKAGFQFGMLGVSIVNFIRNIMSILDTRKKWKKLKPGDQKWPLVSNFIESVMNCIQCFLDSINAFAEQIWSDQLKGWFTVMRNVFIVAKDIISIVASGMEKTQITKSDDALQTALDAAKGYKLNATDDEIAEGMATQNNSQGQFFLRLARNRATREQVTSGFDAGSKTLDSIGTVIGMGEKAAWFNPIAIPFKLASKAVSFISMIINKGLGLSLRRDNIEAMLGDRGLDSVSNFNTVLKEETGINNKHYIADLTRVFMSIDMHVMVHKAAESLDVGETKFATDVVRPYFQKNQDETFPQFASRVTLQRLFKAVGAPDNWRNVLLESISG